MKKYVPLLIIILLIIPAVWALLRVGYFASHDGDWMVIRLSAFHQSLVDGQFPVRWSARLNHGYGYPVLNFLYPLPFYFGELLYLMFRSFTSAVRWVFILSTFASAATMYLWLKNRFTTAASSAGAILYVYTPYRFVDIYVRGSVGEALGFAFVPLIFWGIDQLVRRPRSGIIIGGVAAAATVLAHNVFVIFVAIAFVYGLMTLPKKIWWRLGLLFLIGAALSVYFWLPAIWELRYVQAGSLSVADPHDHLVNLRELLIPRWGYGSAGPGSVETMSFQLGVVNLAVALVALVGRGAYKERKLQFFFVGLFVFSAILMHRVSGFIWTIVPGIAVIQFPWRLLAVTTLASAVLGAWVAGKRSWVPWVIVALSVGATLPYAKIREERVMPENYITTNDDTTTVRAEYNTTAVKTPFSERTEDRIKFTQGRGIVVNFSETNRGMGFRVEASEPAVLELATMNYPGWTAVINGQKTPIEPSANGLITFPVSQGISQVNTYWGETPLRLTANYISLLAILIIVSHGFYAVALKPEASRSQARRREK